MLTFFRPALEAQGDWIEEADLVRHTLDHGNSAKRQLRAFAQDGRFEDVVDLIPSRHVGIPAHFQSGQEDTFAVIEPRRQVTKRVDLGGSQSDSISSS
jgi:hypothetical protein